MTTSVKPIPEGFHTVTPHLVVRGADQAIEFYKKAFGAVEVGRMPGPDGQRLLHAEIKIGDSFLFLNDEFPEMGARCPQTLGGSSCTLTLYLEDADAVWKRAVEAGAQVRLPLADQFWGDRYGKLVDPFGHEWALTTHREDLTPEEIRKRGEAFFAQRPKEGH